LHSQATLPKSEFSPLGNQPVRIPRAEHTLSRHQISQAALSVLYQLRGAGHQAYLVGGGIRDVLLGRTPKDFDVVTDALPDEVRRLFRSCRLIGRRFVLAHVRFNKEIVEVATFRAHHDKGGDGVMEEGRIVRDNVYGTMDEDVWRRDFTVNALYYDISDYSLIDYVNGMADLRTGIIRLIGEPEQRYQEDPVRMLRAIRFAAKLGFTLAPETREPIQELSGLLVEVSAARLFEEVQKLFLSGHAVPSFEQLRLYNLFRPLFPYTDECFTNPTALALVEQVLRNTDERLAEQKSVAPAFLFASLLWPPLLKIMHNQVISELSSPDLLLEASQYLLVRQQQFVAIPRRISVFIVEIWLLQWRLTRRARGRKMLNVLEHPRFRAGYDFLLLRASAGEEAVLPFAKWWTDYIDGDDNARQTLLTQSSQLTHTKKRSRRKKKTKKVEHSEPT
jgi:poly(A) polymerase